MRVLFAQQMEAPEVRSSLERLYGTREEALDGLIKRALMLYNMFGSGDVLTVTEGFLEELRRLRTANPPFSFTQPGSGSEFLKEVYQLVSEFCEQRDYRLSFKPRIPTPPKCVCLVRHSLSGGPDQQEHVSVVTALDPVRKVIDTLAVGLRADRQGGYVRAIPHAEDGPDPIDMHLRLVTFVCARLAAKPATDRYLVTLHPDPALRAT
jgi:hypothetical protein